MSAKQEHERIKRFREMLLNAAMLRFGHDAGGIKVCDAEQINIWVDRVAAMPLEEEPTAWESWSGGPEAAPKLDAPKNDPNAPSWSLESPGVLRLDGTPFTVMHDDDAKADEPFWIVRRDARPVEYAYTLDKAKAFAKRYAAELRELGLLEEAKP